MLFLYKEFYSLDWTAVSTLSSLATSTECAEPEIPGDTESNLSASTASPGRVRLMSGWWWWWGWWWGRSERSNRFPEAVVRQFNR